MRYWCKITIIQTQHYFRHWYCNEFKFILFFRNELKQKQHCFGPTKLRQHKIKLISENLKWSDREEGSILPLSKTAPRIEMLNFLEGKCPTFMDRSGINHCCNGLKIDLWFQLCLCLYNRPTDFWMKVVGDSLVGWNLKCSIFSCYKFLPHHILFG